MSFSPDESASSLFKRSRVGGSVFTWDLITADRSIRKELFHFNEVVQIYAHPKDIQETQLDLLLSFLQGMGQLNALVVHVSTGNSLVSTLVQSGETENACISDMNRRGRLKCVSVNSLLQLYAVLDILQYSLDEDVINKREETEVPPVYTLLLLDHLEPILGVPYEATTQESSPNEVNLTDLLCKIHELVDTQVVLCFWIRSTHMLNAGCGVAAPHPTTVMEGHRAFTYYPRSDIL